MEYGQGKKNSHFLFLASFFSSLFMKYLQEIVQSWCVCYVYAREEKTKKKGEQEDDNIFVQKHAPEQHYVIL